MNPRLIVLLLFLLAACGYKGPLSLPKAPAANKPAATLPAPASAPAPAPEDPATRPPQEAK